MADPLALRAEAVSRQRLLALADLPVSDVRRGVGWTAVRTGVPSNDKNGVVSTGPIDPGTVEELLAWLAGVPACWVTPEPDPDLVARLEAAGGHPERTGHWCGRDLVGGSPLPVEPDPAPWLDVAEACDWFTAAERGPWFRTVAAQDGPAYARWVVREGGVAVGMTAAYAGSVLEITDVAVLPAYRRRGIGSRLVAAATAWGVERGLSEVVAAPSPEGAALFRAHGFSFAPATPDVWIYLPDG